MIYPQNFEYKTGFDKIRQLVAEKCLSPLGEERVADMAFSDSFETVSKLLDQTDEFVRILQGDDEFPAAYFFDVRYSLKRIRPEGTFLDEKELFDLKRSLQTIHDIVRFLHVTEGEEVSYPALTALAGDILVFPQLIGKIDIILDKFGRVKDNASPTLAQIRKEMNATMSSISRSLQSILRAAQADGVVDKDVAPTMRDGRLMIPVAPAYKRKIRGIVHDESATGKTVFIEPEVVVEANNRIRELENDERREIIKILTGFTDIIRPLVPDILQSYEFLADIDFIRAKALFAIKINAIRPSLENKQQIDWFRAIHPLLYLSHQKQNREVVPLDIMLTEEQRLLIISGPNAGGKSVCLKTVGLLQYMLQCGMLIPLYERSRTGIFSGIFIDIGDEQSIENDLSTYSSHLINMKFFVKNCDAKTIILIDEFGSGTEPQIGGAIAEALLDRFNRNKSFGVITTHYQNLKHFAEDSPGLVNGAMLYDRHLMQPLFKLSIGNPGSSFAVEIARKIGLPEDVITDASAIVGSDYINMDKYLQDIVRDKRYWETKRQNIRQQEKKLEDVTTRYEHNLEAVDKQRKEIIREAKEEAQRIIANANTKIENTIREIKEAQAEKEQTKLARKALDEFKASVLATEEADEKIARQMTKLKERQERKKQKQKAPEKQPFNKDVIETGDQVRLKGQVSAGTVLEMHGKQALVAFGMIKSTVSLDKLEKVSKGQIKKEMKKSTFVSSQTTDDMREKKLNFKQEIDVRGMRGDEALQAVTYFIDDAILVGASPVRILHGTGTGALRQLIREYLRMVPGIHSFRDEHVQLGGAGITVVELA
ncbi:DNA mismatch repair protein MutS2 [Parabacteroides sp. PF5-5]|uniref:endonuclease MutS2 n=1 Tax=unclassified Parabacteroides TaxID=2649774 RepID=UPI002475B066|nr:MULTISPECIES: Smr/MutS family protein [unclassified Parabacteroides]MDH6305560.1 DNA mismatch repair protein MutS2 [Parabacteroides sp. PH5-39]MDH6316400.1 DNA mismatch repair protein MutS2 [Parabacteroides sp. PF5-13]MDH6319885.1 DNA mismatch repair protein MutS2 [Parabacteroides sp. PH5-13]MDH6323524.1 DNA mismatch repair protein MutS2 [Parabacteroides sp. PH5-8]MDH6327587.1 DNA mismatch repair protein MutS2 [Parabacteroides sp. PH5-41]